MPGLSRHTCPGNSTASFKALENLPLNLLILISYRIRQRLYLGAQTVDLINECHDDVDTLVVDPHGFAEIEAAS